MQRAVTILQSVYTIALLLILYLINSAPLSSANSQVDSRPSPSQHPRAQVSQILRATIDCKRLQSMVRQRKESQHDWLFRLQKFTPRLHLSDTLQQLSDTAGALI